MNDPVVNAISWVLILSVPINTYFVWHGWVMNRLVSPRSPVLRALLWTKFSIWLLGVYFGIIGYRYLAHLEPILPFGGIGLGIVIIFILTVPGVIHSQMRAFIDGDKATRGGDDG